MADHDHDEDAPDVDYEGEEDEEQNAEGETTLPASGGSSAAAPASGEEAAAVVVAKPGAGDSETDSDDDDGPRPAPPAEAAPPVKGRPSAENAKRDIETESEDGEVGGGEKTAPPPRRDDRDNADDDDNENANDDGTARGYRHAPSAKMDRALDTSRETMLSERPKEDRRGDEGRLIVERRREEGGFGGNDYRGRMGGFGGNGHGDGRFGGPVRKQPFEERPGVYIPPAKRRLLEEQRKAQDAAVGGGGNDGVGGAKDSNGSKGGVDTVTPIQVQRQSWEALQRSINGTINRLSPSTIKPLIHSLFSEANLLRGRGVLARSIMRASQASPQYTPTYAALVAVVNTKLPECGEILLTRAILEFRRGYKRRDRDGVASTLALLGHLFNQGVAHELLSLQILTVLLDGETTEDSVDVAAGYMCIVGRRLAEVSPAGVRAVTERFRGLLHEGSVGRRGQYRIEMLLKAKQGGFEDYPTIPDEGDLDLVEREDQITFELGLDDDGLSNEVVLDSFQFNVEYDKREKEWKEIRAEILGEDSDDESGSDSGSDSDSESGSEFEDKEEAPGQDDIDKKKTVAIEDLTETDLVHLRRTIYLTIMSSATFEECTHKLAKMDIPDGRESELVNMIIECCSQERTFLRYYGLVSGRFCLLHERWQDAFEEGFATQYNTIHRLETNKLRNVAKLFGHLLHTDSVSWGVLACIHLNEDETTSSSRIFIKILVQEMAEAMGMVTLKQRFDTDNPNPDGPVGEDSAAITAAVAYANGETMNREWFKGMFPKGNARNTRYAINFFTSIGLGPLTDGMREFLKNAPKLILAQAQAQAARKAAQKEKDDDESSVISSSSSDTSSFDSSSSSSSTSVSSSSRSSYTSSSSYTSNSSDSYYRRRKGRGRGCGRDRTRGGGMRSRSYSSSSSSSSGSNSSPDSRGGRRKYSSKDQHGGRRSGGRASTSRDRNDDSSKDARNDGTSSKATPDTGSKRRSVSVSPLARSGRKDDHCRSSRRSRSYSSSRSRFPSRGGSSEKGHIGSRGKRGSRSSSSPPHWKSSPGPPSQGAQRKERGGRKKRARSSSYSSASRSRSPPARRPSRSGKWSRRSRTRSDGQSLSSGRN